MPCLHRLPPHSAHLDLCAVLVAVLCVGGMWPRFSGCTSVLLLGMTPADVSCCRVYELRYFNIADNAEEEEEA